MTGTDQAQAAVRAHALLLAWYREMGVDAAVGEEPINWLERGDARPGAGYDIPALADVAPVPSRTPPRAPMSSPSVGAPAAARSAPGAAPARPALKAVPAGSHVGASSGRQFPTAAPDEATLTARETARAATSIEDLRERLAAFDGCGLKATAKSLCFYRGATPARVMVIGEAPGAEEDKVGKPFVGPAGQMLDKMLAAIGLDESQAHITNIVYWRPPGNRTPTPQEALVCRPFLERQVELVKPEIILLLGGPASNHILDKPEGIMKLRGKWRDVTIGTHSMRAIATLHPAYLLRTPLAKRMAWRDMLTIAAHLDPESKA